MNNRSIKNPRDLINLIANLPKMIKLHYRLLKDSRTPFNLKMILILALVYVISPIDLIPDLLAPVIGQIDDIVILIAASQFFLKKCPPELVTEHIRKIDSESVK